jgi:hypothetical protein
MSNETIAKRILEVIEAYETGKTSASSVAQSVELHEPAMESIPKATRDKLHELSLKIMDQDVSPLEEKILGIRPSRDALMELKILLGQLR